MNINESCVWNKQVLKEYDMYWICLEQISVCSCKDNNLMEKNLFKITEHDQEKLFLQSTRTCIPESRGS